MRCVQTWSDLVPERDDVKSSIWDLAFSPDGNFVVAAAGSRVLVYDSQSGDLVHTLKSHKDTVYTVAYSNDGDLFASGGADGTVILWNKNGEGILKYTHNDSIQKICFNPVTKTLISCTANDFGMCIVESKAVTRNRVSAKILSCDWTCDGQFLALGMNNGQISIRDQSGQEKVAIQRNAPVWTLCWNPSPSESVHILAVGCWDQTLSFYQLSGLQVGKDKKLDFDPCSVSYFDDGNYLLVGGSDRQVTLYSRDGVKLSVLKDMDDWCWVCKGCPNKPLFVAGSNSGSIAMQQLKLSPVNGLYEDRFAFTEGMTDIVVQHLITDQRVRIKCRDYVKKVALYKNRLAVQHPDKIVVYELTNELDPFDLRYRVRDKISHKIDCNLLVVTSLHVILCHDRKLQLFDFSGKKEKEWVLESVIRYMKVVGGAPGREGLLVGLQSGDIYRVFVDNPFPIPLIKHRACIRCLDLSMSREKLAVVDTDGDCVVYDLRTGEEMYTEPNATSVAWNAEHEDMLCFSNSDILSIKTGSFPVHQQPMQGITVGFKGSKIFCLKALAMETVDVPQSTSLYNYLQIKDFSMAYKVACLGVTEADWRFLALTALQALELEFARKAFIRVRDVKYLELINSIELDLKRGESQQVLGIYQAQILAYQGKFQEAAKQYAKLGVPEKAIDMFSDLRLWEEAKAFASNAGSVDVRELIQRQAEWAQEVGDTKLASEMYSAAGQYDKAIEIVGEAGCLDELIEVARVIDKKDTELLRKCAWYFTKYGHHQYAKEVYLKMNDVQALMKLHVDLYKWDEAFLLFEQHGSKFAEDVYLPYAQWLVENDRFDEAQSAFKKAQQPEKSMKMLKQLAQSSLIEQRFEDAAYYLWLLSEEVLGMVNTPFEDLSNKDMKTLKQFEHFRYLANQYFAYAVVHKTTDEPFSSLEPESVFNAARYLMNTHSVQIPYGISRAAILWALGKQGELVGAYKLARHAYDRLGNLRVPELWQASVDLETLILQSKPFTDHEDHYPTCLRCATPNSLINNSPGEQGDSCMHCGHPFIRSLKSFDLLPLVEFVPEPGCSDLDAFAMLQTELASEARVDNGVDRISFDRPESSDADAFSKYMLSKDFSQQGLPYDPLQVPEKVLKQTSMDNVFVVKWRSEGKRWQFFKNIIPDVRVCICNSCNSFFHEEDLETICLSNGNKCPLCKASISV